MGLTRYLATFATDVLRELGTLMLVVGAVGGALAARPMARRYGRPPWLVAAVAVALTLIAAATLVPSGSVWEFLRDPIEHNPSPRSCVAGGGWRMLALLWDDPGGPLNVVLFVPAALTLTLWTGRPGRVMAALCGMSLGIEAVQLLIDRQCEAGDLLANALGAAVGAGLATAFGRRHLTSWTAGSP